MEALYREDRETGHFALVTELLGGITRSLELRVGIEAATQPWLDFVEEQVELRNRIDGNVDRSDRLFRLGHLAAGLMQSQTVIDPSKGAD